FTLTADSGTNQVIADGNTLTIAGGTNGIDTVVGATDLITINLDTTEIATATFGSGSAFTWTFNSGAAQDPSIAFGSGSIAFDDANLTSALPLTVSDNGINAALSQGIVDSIND